MVPFFALGAGHEAVCHVCLEGVVSLRLSLFLRSNHNVS